MLSKVKLFFFSLICKLSCQTLNVETVHFFKYTKYKGNNVLHILFARALRVYDVDFKLYSRKCFNGRCLESL